MAIRVILVLAFLLPGVGAVSPGTLLWEAKPGFRDFGGMAESAGIVVSGNITGKGAVAAFSSETGKLLWKLVGGQMMGRPSIGEQRVFAVVAQYPNHRLVALDLKTGKLLWAVTDYKLGDDAGPLASDGKVFLVSRNGKVNAYDAATGRPTWESSYAPEDPECPTGLAVSHGRVFFGGGQHNGSKTAGKYLWALDAETGKQLWRYRVVQDPYDKQGDCISTPVAAGEIVATTSQNGMYVLDAATGSLQWKRDIRRKVGEYLKGRDLSPALITGDGRAVYAYYPEGLIGWTTNRRKRVGEVPGKFSDGNWGFTLSESGGVIFCTADLPGDEGAYGKLPLHAIDLATKRILWTHRVNRPVEYVSDWVTHDILATGSGVYYENNGLLAKVAR